MERDGKREGMGKRWKERAWERDGKRKEMVGKKTKTLAKNRKRKRKRKPNKNNFM
jgi:hypothetical protein